MAGARRGGGEEGGGWKALSGNKGSKHFLQLCTSFFATFVYNCVAHQKKKSINAQPTRNWRSPTSAKQKGIIIILQHICVREKKKQIKEQHKVNRVWSELFLFILNAGHYCFSILSHFHSISRLLKTELDNVVELNKYKEIKSSSIT